MYLGEVRKVQLAESTLLTSKLVPLGIFSDLLSSFQMLKRAQGAESNGKLPHLFIPSETATLVSEICGERPVFEQNCGLGA